MGHYVLDRPMVECGLALVTVQRHEGHERHTVRVAPHRLCGFACRTSSTLIWSAEFHPDRARRRPWGSPQQHRVEDPVNVQQDHRSHGRRPCYLGGTYWGRLRIPNVVWPGGADNPLMATQPGDQAPFDFTTGLAWGRPCRLLFRRRQRGASPPLIRVCVDSAGFTCEPASPLLKPFAWVGWIPGHLRVEWRDVAHVERLDAMVLQVVPKSGDALQIGWTRPSSLDRMATMAKAAVGPS